MLLKCRVGEPTHSVLSSDFWNISVIPKRRPGVFKAVWGCKSEFLLEVSCFTSAGTTVLYKEEGNFFCWFAYIFLFCQPKYNSLFLNKFMPNSLQYGDGENE